ncbi:MAG: hypothetical protein FWD71_04270 [Oscillospiraceae bacterium]|nr:hypothetical protein [Oscillospiraceae bacterium]
MKNIKKILCAIIALTFVLAVFSGCSNSTSGGNNTTLQTETISDTNGIKDTMDYTFVPDSEAVGNWTIVDGGEKNIDDFDSAKPNYTPEQLYQIQWQNVSLSDDGTAKFQFINSMSVLTTTWTKGYILNILPDTISAYTIKKIDNDYYMFAEWKSGDYSIRGQKPLYCVLKKTSDTLYSELQTQVATEGGTLSDSFSTGYSFVADSDAVGQWNVVDSVDYITHFDPSAQSFNGDVSKLLIQNLKFSQDGTVSVVYNSQQNATVTMTWTKGYVVNSGAPGIISAYKIVNIGGVNYMFFELKNGDYVLRGMQPPLLVFKKAS